MAAYTNVTMVSDSDDVLPMMGANVNAAYTTTMQDTVGLLAEAYVCGLVRYDAVTNWATIGAIEKTLMTEIVSRFIAMQGIAYDMSVYTSRIEAEDMINIHIFRMRQISNLLKDQKILTFIKRGTP